MVENKELARLYLPEGRYGLGKPAYQQRIEEIVNEAQLKELKMYGLKSVKEYLVLKEIASYVREGLEYFIESLEFPIEETLKYLIEKREVIIENGYVKNLYLRNYGLKSLPEDIGNLVNLEYLGVDGNQFTEIPKSIGKLRNLKKLVADFNLLTELPEEIGKLVNLEELSVMYNRLTEIPKWIEYLVNLEELDIGYNQITKLPEEIGYLPNLEKLYVKNNPLNDASKKLLKELEKRGVKVY